MISCSARLAQGLTANQGKNRKTKQSATTKVVFRLSKISRQGPGTRPDSKPSVVLPGAFFESNAGPLEGFASTLSLLDSWDAMG